MTDVFKILFYYFRQKNRSFSTREGLEKWQEKQVKSYIKWVKKHSPFYREILNGKEEKMWRTFPTMDKTMMMEHFSTFNTKGILKEQALDIAFEAEKSRDFSPTLNSVTIGLSSGTSGNRGLFLVSNEERVKWAGHLLAKVLPNGIFSKEKIAFFLRANSNLYTTVESRRIQFEFYDLLCPLNEHVKRLNEQQPSILVAPPRLLRLLADEVKKETLLISPAKIISVADVLEEWDRNDIQQAFGKQIHQIYQCTEGFLAHTCSHGTLHLNEDLLVIEKEYLDEEKTKFSPIITDFSRTTQPMIRYRLNDILVEKKEQCECGSIFTALERIEGRCDDIFYISHETKNEKVPVFPDFIRRSVLTSSEDITDYRVKQVRDTEIEVALKIKEGKSEVDIEKAVQVELESLMQNMQTKQVKIIFVPYEEKSVDQKMRRIQRDIKE